MRHPKHLRKFPLFGFYRQWLWVPTIGLALMAAACNKQDGGRNQTGGAPSGTGDNPDDGTTPGEGGDTPTGDSKNATVIRAEDLPATELFTKKAIQDNCVTATFTALADTEPVADVEMVFSFTADPAGDDTGKVEPATAKTNAEGQASTTYCSGDTETKVIIIAKAADLSANSGEITVKHKPVYVFSYVKSDAPIVVAPAPDAPPEDKGVIKLNLIDSGPNDCTYLYYKLTKSEAPVVGATVQFRTQVDFPKGAKLAKKPDPALVQTETATQKKYAYYFSTSNTSGEFAVPVCAGVSLGTMVVSATYTDDENKTYATQSPVISIMSGVTNWQNMSLTYDPENAKTLRGYFNTNSNHIHPFTVKLGARQDGDPISEYPVAVAAETGKITIASGGMPSTEGTVGFTMQALHMVDYRPYQVQVFGNGTNYPEAQTRCDPEQISQAGGLTYKQLSKNWRSTIVYMVRGQEAYHDANRNGKYDVGGDGFWDKNQNGYYDSADLITFDAGNDNTVDPNGEWFIDLPAPFIDVDEDGNYNANKDVLIGDEYFSPNGKRDTDALLWKYDYIPIYMGASAYSLTHGSIPAVWTDNSDTIGQSYFTDLNTRGIGSGTLPSLFNASINHQSFWGASPTDQELASYGEVERFLFAQGVCGNPLPGGTDLTINITNTSISAYGDRQFTGHFFIQPGDFIREPSRQLLKSATGSSSAKVNFNVVDHPASNAGFPVEFEVHVSPCLNACTGDVATPGVACDGKSALVSANFDGTAPGFGVSIPAVITCTCITGADFKAGACACPGKQIPNDNNDACIDPP